MAVLTTAARKKLPSKSFALPGKGEGPHGKGAGSYPIPDKAHARNALARVSAHGTSAEKATVRRKVHAKYPDIGKKQLGGIAPLARPRPLVGAPRTLTPRPVVGAARAPRPVGARAPARRVPRRPAFRKGGIVGAGAMARPHTYGPQKPIPGSKPVIGSSKGHGGFAALGIHYSK
jgi:hypothetical protein